jgi:hypothetical protein
MTIINAYRVCVDKYEANRHLRSFEDKLRWLINKQGVKAKNGTIRLMKEAGLLWAWHVIFGLYNRQRLFALVRDHCFLKKDCELSSIFWDITPRSPLKVKWRFGWTCLLHIFGRRIGLARNQPAICFMLVSCLDNCSTLKMDVTCFSEMSVDFLRTTERYMPENRAPHNHRCKSLKSYIRR